MTGSPRASQRKGHTGAVASPPPNNSKAAFQQGFFRPEWFMRLERKGIKTKGNTRPFLPQVVSGSGWIPPGTQRLLIAPELFGELGLSVRQPSGVGGS